jgi:hypothetical protein
MSYCYRKDGELADDAAVGEATACDGYWGGSVDNPTYGTAYYACEFGVKTKIKNGVSVDRSGCVNSAEQCCLGADGAFVSTWSFYQVSGSGTGGVWKIDWATGEVAVGGSMDGTFYSSFGEGIKLVDSSDTARCPGTPCWNYYDWEELLWGTNDEPDFYISKEANGNLLIEKYRGNTAPVVYMSSETGTFISGPV